MALSAEQLTWLSKDNIRVILVEAEYNVDTFTLYCNNDNTDPDRPFDVFCDTGNTIASMPKIYCNTTAVQSANESLYLANTPYVTDGTPFDDVAGNSVSNIGYVDVLDNIPSISSSIDGSTTTSSIQFLNTLGDYDFVFDRDNYAFEGQEVKILIGDPSWPRANFITVFTGIIVSVSDE